MADTPRYEVPAQMRDLAENSVAQARKAFDSFMGAARRAAETAQESVELTNTNRQAMYTRGFDFAEQNVQATFDYAQKLARARTLQEVMQIQTEYVRSQFGAMQAQAKEFGGMAQGAMQQGAGQVRKVMAEGQDAVRKGVRQATDQGRNT
jgi:phasin